MWTQKFSASSSKYVFLAHITQNLGSPVIQLEASNGLGSALLLPILWLKVQLLGQQFTSLLKFPLCIRSKRTGILFLLLTFHFPKYVTEYRLKKNWWIDKYSLFIEKSDMHDCKYENSPHDSLLEEVKQNNKISQCTK